MKRVRFRDPAGSTRWGAWTDDGVAFAGRTYDFEEVDVLPPCEPSKIVCIGRNYVEHAAEFDNPVPDRPMLFLKGPNCLAGHGDTVPLLPGKDRIDYEGEFAVVIDEQCRNVRQAEAWDVIAGFTLANDVSNRDDQQREQNWIRGKAFDNSAPTGPALVPPEEVPDDAELQVHVNGERRQRGSLDNLVFSIPELIEDITTYLTLEPGDLVLAGTPEGVGPLEAGDTVEIEMEGIPPLVHDVGEPDPPR